MSKLPKNALNCCSLLLIYDLLRFTYDRKFNYDGAESQPCMVKTVFSISSPPPATKSPSRSSPGSGVSSGGNSTNGKARRANSRNNNSPNLLGRETERQKLRKTKKAKIINRTGSRGRREVEGVSLRSLVTMKLACPGHKFLPTLVAKM